MNKLYKYMVTIFIVSIVNATGVAYAQQGDTLVVEWLTEDGNDVLKNSLYETIIADTNEAGERYENRVYKLKQGGFYYIQEAIQNDGFHLNIVGEKGDPTDEFKNPPMLQITSREDATVTGKMFNIRGDFTLKNVILNGKTTDGGLQYEIVDIRYDNGRFTFDNVIFEYSQWGLMGFYSPGADIIYTNNTVRNFISETQPWGGRGFSVWADTDTIWAENNTFLNVGFTLMQVEGASANYVWFNHNTIVNNGRQLMLWHWVKDGFFSNNLVLNGFWHGEDRTQISDVRLESDDEQYTGMFDIREIPAKYGLDAQRRFVIANNAFHLEEEYTNYFTTDNDTFAIRKQPVLNVLTTNFFSEYDNMVYVDNTEDQGEPGFVSYPDNHQDRINFLTDMRNGNSPIRTYYWDPSRDESNESIQWPLPEDLTYSNDEYKSGGITGYPLGDLNWYPDVKADWEANKGAEYQAVLDKVGEAPEVEFLSEIEAESGTISGGSEVAAAPTRYLARIEASGDIVWEGVELTAGSYDMVVSHRTWYGDGNTGRQTDISINDGDNIALTIGVEQDGVTWSDQKLVGVSFADGANKVALKKSWGYMEYAWVKLLETGTENVVATLWPGEATLVGGGSYICSEEGGLCTSGDSFVHTGDGGDVTLTYEAPGTGSFLVRLSYFLTAGDTDVELMVNGSSVGSQTVSGSDSTMLQVDFSGVPMNMGNNEIKLSSTSGGIGLDKVGIFSVGSLSTNNEITNRIDGYTLSQNYPNPFNPSTTLNFSIPVASNVQLNVYNLLGQKVATLIDGPRLAGQHQVRFDARNLASGVYFYQIQAGDFTMQRKMTLIK